MVCNNLLLAGSCGGRSGAASSRVMPLRLIRLGNPFVRAVLRSPAHRLLSGALCVLTYTGRRSRSTYSIPVMYAQHGNDILVIAAVPERKRWWRTFETPAPATLLVRRQSLAVVGRTLEGAERREALRAYLVRFPRAGSALRASAGAADADLDLVDAVIVLFSARIVS